MGAPYPGKQLVLSIWLLCITLLVENYSPMLSLCVIKGHTELFFIAAKKATETIYEAAIAHPALPFHHSKSVITSTNL